MNSGKICVTCGTKYPESFTGNTCSICEDDRQYVPQMGQKWTNDKTLLRNHSVKIRKIKDRLYEFVINPNFAIGQRALLILSEQGNVLWDCISMLDEAARTFIKQKGGLKAVVISHPHYYSNMQAWAKAFNCPIYLHQEDEKWVVNKSEKIKYWRGASHELWEDMQIIKIGGHFPACSVILAPKLSKTAALFCGDTFSIAPSMQHIAVMYSYPNKIPLSVAEVARIKKLMEPVEFDEIYGFWSSQNITKNAKKLLMDSLNRYS